MSSSQGPSISQPPARTKGYANRNSFGIAAPLNWSDDSEFAAGPIEPEKPKSKKRTKTKGDLKRGSKKKVAAGDLDAFFTAPRPPKSKAQGQGRTLAVINEPNPLLEFFANEDIVFNPVSDNESETGEAVEADEVGDMDEGDEGDRSDVSDSPPCPSPPLPVIRRKDVRMTNVPRPFKYKPAIFYGSEPESPDEEIGQSLKRKSRSRAASTAKRQKLETPQGDNSGTKASLQDEKPTVNSAVNSSSSQVQEDTGSTTESTSEDKAVPLQPRTTRKATSAQRRKHTGSTTENSSDDEVTAKPASVQSMPSSRKPSPVSIDDDSVTESDYELDLETEALAARKKNPKPGFPLKKGQRLEPALVLDRPQNIKVPSPINTFLRPYQRDGIQFFWRQYSQGRGGLLGDDMGLGKTIQVISFLSAIMKKEGIRTDRNRRKKYVSRLQDGEQWRRHRKLPPANAKWPTCLIIAPNALVLNWAREFEKWGYFEVGMYKGKQAIRGPVLHDFELGRLDVVITSYEYFQKDVDLLCDLAWSCVFVDEVHRAKNSKSATTEALHQLHCQVRFGLTGTLIQNSYHEIWSILDWTNPGRLGNKKQWATYVTKPLTTGQSAAATGDEQAKAAIVARVLKDKLLPRFFLRRTKDIIKNQLPKKTDEVVFCPLSAAQIQVYRRILQTAEVQNMLKRNEPCSCGRTKKRKDCCHPFEVSSIFKYMSILIKLSNHLCLILPGAPNDTPEQTRRNREFAQIAFPDGNAPKYAAAFMQTQFCGKWDACKVLFKQWRKDPTNKVLLFTKSVKLLSMLEQYLGREGYGFLKLEGSVPLATRMELIDQFHEDPNIFIFLISTLAGGVGLNLTAANKVIIFDPNWNPAHDLQAMDRSYRFGQERDVSVYRLLGAGSVEELIYARQIYKQQQMAIGYDASIQTRYFEGVQGDASKQGELFGLENIFKLHEDTIATKMAIEKAHMSELDWALANMKVENKRKKAKLGEKTSALLEAEAKATAKDEMSLTGLGALLFDDDPTIAEGDDLRKALSVIGIKYSHKNNEVLEPSKIEAERAKQNIKKRAEKRGQKGKGKEKDNVEENTPRWPPIRRHHKKKALERTPEEIVEARREALVALGLVNSPADLAAYAAAFAKETLEAQREIIAELDTWEGYND